LNHSNGVIERPYHTRIPLASPQNTMSAHLDIVKANAQYVIGEKGSLALPPAKHLTIGMSARAACLQMPTQCPK
jgi:hypothetical protein